MPLPQVSHSALPAPKHSGCTDHAVAVAGSFWARESEHYWKKRRRSKRSKQTLTAVATAAAAVVILTVVVVLGRSETAANSDSAIEEGILISRRDAEIVQLRRHACAGNARRQELESVTCARTCAKARTAAPRPLAHRSCLAGCRGGISTAWESGCAGGRHQDCTRSALTECDGQHCESYRNQLPKPTIFNTCQRACFDVIDDACIAAKEVFVENSAGLGGTTDTTEL